MSPLLPEPLSALQRNHHPAASPSLPLFPFPIPEFFGLLLPNISE